MELVVDPGYWCNPSRAYCELDSDNNVGVWKNPECKKQACFCHTGTEGNQWLFVPDKKPYADAELYCENYGRHLVSVHMGSEWENLHMGIVANFLSDKKYRVGENGKSCHDTCQKSSRLMCDADGMAYLNDVVARHTEAWANAGTYYGNNFECSSYQQSGAASGPSILWSDCSLTQEDGAWPSGKCYYTSGTPKCEDKTSGFRRVCVCKEAAAWTGWDDRANKNEWNNEDTTPSDSYENYEGPKDAANYDDVYNFGSYTKTATDDNVSASYLPACSSYPSLPLEDQIKDVLVSQNYNTGGEKLTTTFKFFGQAAPGGSGGSTIVNGLSIQCTEYDPAGGVNTRHGPQTYIVNDDNYIPNTWHTASFTFTPSTSAGVHFLRCALIDRFSSSDIINAPCATGSTGSAGVQGGLRHFDNADAIFTRGGCSYAQTYTKTDGSSWPTQKGWFKGDCTTARSFVCGYRSLWVGANSKYNIDANVKSCRVTIGQNTSCRDISDIGTVGDGKKANNYNENETTQHYLDRCHGWVEKDDSDGAAVEGWYPVYSKNCEEKFDF